MKEKRGRGEELRPPFNEWFTRSIKRGRNEYFQQRSPQQVGREQNKPRANMFSCSPSMTRYLWCTRSTFRSIHTGCQSAPRRHRGQVKTLCTDADALDRSRTAGHRLGALIQQRRSQQFRAVCVCVGERDVSEVAVL